MSWRRSPITGVGAVTQKKKKKEKEKKKKKNKKKKKKKTAGMTAVTNNRHRPWPRSPMIADAHDRGRPKKK